MRKIVFYLVILCFVAFTNTSAQVLFPKINEKDPALPSWVKLMYSENPNIYEIEIALHNSGLEGTPENKIYESWFNRWKGVIKPYISANGTIDWKQNSGSTSETGSRTSQSGNWTFAGPKVHYTTKYAATDPSIPLSEQSNMYCISRCATNPDVLYSGSESGGVYRSNDHGLTWNFVTAGLPVYDVSAVAVHPGNPDFAIFSARNELYYTQDGGISWAIMGDPSFQSQNISAWQIEFHPINWDTIFASTNIGLWRSADAGNTWTEIFPEQSLSHAFMPGAPDTMYALRCNSQTLIADFYKSTDGGLNFSLQNQGWFTVPSVDSGLIESLGGRIAVTEANPQKVYVLMVGNSQSSAQLQLKGFLGVYVSNDVGQTWINPHGQIGMPYDINTHPNLMDFDGQSSTYNQIYYNTTMAVSQLDENKILIGGLNLWRSDDGAASYQAVGGYIGPLPYLHVDFQEIKSFKTGPASEELWLTSDGGINYSTDWITSHESRCYGLYGGPFWGYDQGWNEDIRVGGRYHNGNAGYHENYPDGSFLALGGGEAPTGYVNYSPGRKTYFSDIDGRILPDSLEGLASYFGMQFDPNESYWENSSSRILFDWRYWNFAYSGKSNVIYKSKDGGISFAPLYTFGSTTADNVLWIEQSRVDENILYVHQNIGYYNSILWKSTDGGVSWNLVNMPLSGYRELVFTLGLENADDIWVAYTYSGNGQKVYYSPDGGITWQNLSTSTLDNLQPGAIAHQGGTDGGIYLATRDGQVFYRNSNLTDWEMFSNGLPVNGLPLKLQPYYKSAKIRLATWTMSIWESDFYEPSTLIAEFSTAMPQFFCPGDTIQFNDHSISTGSVQRTWSFPGSVYVSQDPVSPKVVYNQPGQYDVTLSITDGVQTSSVTRSSVVQSVSAQTLPLNEGFETGALPTYWKLQDDGNNGGSWVVSNLAGGYGNSTYSLIFDNFYQDVSGYQDQAWTAKYDFSSTQVQHPVEILFDRAYAEYGFPYTDTLAVYYSVDCGATFTQVYLKGGQDLATAPNFTSTIYVPTSSEWKTDTLLFSITDPEVILVFENRGHYGQAIYVDNLRIGNLTVGISPETTIRLTAFPNPVTNKLNVQTKGFSEGNLTYLITDVSGKQIVSGLLPQGKEKDLYEVSTEILSPGIYFLELSSDLHSKGLIRFVKQ